MSIIQILNITFRRIIITLRRNIDYCVSNSQFCRIYRHRLVVVTWNAPEKCENTVHHDDALVMMVMIMMTKTPRVKNVLINISLEDIRWRVGDEDSFCQTLDRRLHMLLMTLTDAFYLFHPYVTQFLCVRSQN